MKCKLYKDNDGDAFGDRSGELKHYNVEYGPAAVSITHQLWLIYDSKMFNSV